MHPQRTSAPRPMLQLFQPPAVNAEIVFINDPHNSAMTPGFVYARIVRAVQSACRIYWFGDRVTDPSRELRLLICSKTSPFWYIDDQHFGTSTPKILRVSI
jgi:hypothetical protein